MSSRAPAAEGAVCWEVSSCGLRHVRFLAMARCRSRWQRVAGMVDGPLAIER